MRKKLFKNKTVPEAILFSIVFIFFVLYAFLLIYPLVWGGLSSLKTPSEYWDNMFGFPKIPQFKNYSRAISEITNGGLSFSDMAWNSIWFAGGSAIISSEFTSAYAYVLNKYRFRGRDFLYNLCIFLMAVPIGASFVAAYRLYYALKITNSYLILLSATGVYNMNLILMHSYYSNISRAYMEAAQIDGANFYQIYFKAMRPQATPMVMTLALLTFIGKWNDYMSPLLYLPSMPTLATGLFRYQKVVERSGNNPVLFSGLLICLMPILVLFAIFNDKLMGNISIGGLKG